MKFTVSVFIPLFDNLAFRRIYNGLSNLNLPFTNCIIFLTYIIFYAIPLLSYNTHLLLVSQYRMLICNLSQYITPYIMYFLLSPVACCGEKWVITICVITFTEWWDLPKHWRIFTVQALYTRSVVAKIATTKVMHRCQSYLKSRRVEYI